MPYASYMNVNMDDQSIVWHAFVDNTYLGKQQGDGRIRFTDYPDNIYICLETPNGSKWYTGKNEVFLFTDLPPEIKAQALLLNLK